ncbi:MAG: MaoC/PaaZ C-terminal domain-containing protein [Anaerolineae bacterium]|jgi:acyl dehydratase|nr:MaoC/PaaZ C-terminal domain-containing protein [Anaerolineae bacterium]MDH7475409.1 MaoC/PaaZ C-terminal domain-containing protein [Anaerolineae bacterium]
MTERGIAPTRGLYFEDFEIGDEVVTQGRTITEADVVAFAALSGDWNPLHTDAEYAKTTMFGQRVAHGLLILAIASGLAVRLGFMEETVLAFRELTWKFSRPVVIGDTVRVRATVYQRKAMPRLEGGAVVFDVAVLNQRDEVVEHGQWTVLFKSRPQK